MGILQSSPSPLKLAGDESSSASVIIQLTHISSEEGCSRIDLTEAGDPSFVLRQVAKQQRVPAEAFDPFTYFGALQIDKLSTVEEDKRPAPWVQQMFKNPAPSKFLCRSKENKKKTVLDYSNSAMMKSLHKTDGLALKNSTNLNTKGKGSSSSSVPKCSITSFKAEELYSSGILRLAKIVNKKSGGFQEI